MTQWALIIEDKEHCFAGSTSQTQLRFKYFQMQNMGCLGSSEQSRKIQLQPTDVIKMMLNFSLYWKRAPWLPATPFLSIISKGETRYSFDQLLSINQHLTIGSNKTRWRHHSLLTTPFRDTGSATLAVTPMSLHHSNPYKRIPENLSAATASPPFSS